MSLGLGKFEENVQLVLKWNKGDGHCDNLRQGY